MAHDSTGWGRPRLDRRFQPPPAPNPARSGAGVPPIEAKVRRLERTARTVTSRVATAALIREIDALIVSLRDDFRGPLSPSRKEWTRRCKTLRDQLSNRSAEHSRSSSGGRRTETDIDKLCRKYDKSATRRPSPYQGWGAA